MANPGWSSRPWQGVFVLLFVWLLAFPATARSRVPATPGFDIAPAPAWIEPVASTPSDFARDGALGGVALHVVDMQQSISDTSDWRYIHTVEEIVNEIGVATLGEVTFDFSPAHERLVLHRIEIHRDGAVLSRLSAEAVQVLQRERSLEERIYDGEQTAVIVLPDVRVGDVVVREFSIVGRNPVFGSNAATGVQLEFMAPIGVMHLVVASKRTLHRRLFGGAPSPEVDVEAGVTRHRWHLERVAPSPEVVNVPYEERTRSAMFGTTSEWSEVGVWGSRLFRGARDDTTALAAVADSIRAEHTDVEARALAAVRFVQEDIRYFALSMAESSHRPAAPSIVLARRFGDCKDKSQLLVTLLEALGIEAHVVLVTTGGDTLLEDLPTVRAFDHAIVAIDGFGARVFVDPTTQLARGSLADGGVRGYGHGLLLGADGGDLVEIPDAPQTVRDIDAKSLYAFEAWGQPVSLELDIRYGDGSATGIRNRVAGGTTEWLRKSLLESVRQEHPDAELVGEIEYRDFEDARGIDVTQRFVISKWSTDDDGTSLLSVAPFMMSGRLPPLEPDRTLPLALPAPLQLRHEIEIHTPEPVAVEPENDVFDGGPVHSSYRARGDGNTIRIEHTLDVVERRAEPDELGSLRTQLSALDENYTFSIWMTSPETELVDAGFDWMIVMVGVSWTLVVVVLIGIVHVKQPWLPRPEVRYEPGLTDIGGWMVLLAIRVVVLPGALVYQLWSTAETLEGPTWHALTTPGSSAYHAGWAPALLFELCANLTLLVASIYLVYAFWARRRSFPWLFLVTLAFSLVTTFIDDRLAAMLPIEPGDAAPAEAGKELVRAIGWGLYVLLSSRVRSRFLPPPPDAPALHDRIFPRR